MTTLVFQVDPADEISAQAIDTAELMKDLEAAEASPQTEESIFKSATVVSMVTLATVTVAALVVIVTFIHKVYRVGVVIDNRQTPPIIRRDKNLPRGSVLHIKADGTEELREGLSIDHIVDLLKTILGLKTA